ncbi:MAG: hypothetical protein ACI3WR_02650 [Oscillospiraceae bacterium]
MSDFEDKLNTLLGDPNSMAQIMQLAQSLSGGGAGAAGTQQGAAAAPPPPPQASPPPPPSPSPAGGASAEGFDPQLLGRFMPLLREMQSQENSNAAQLLLALRPYLREEKQEKVGRAIQIAKLIRMGKSFFSSLEG